MLCPNCGKELLETSKSCENCGAPIGVEFSEVNELPQENPKSVGLKSILHGICIVVFWGVVIFYGTSWIRQKNAEEDFNKQIYQQAANEYLSHWKDPDCIEIADYEKEYVNLMEWDYHDFGCGNLRYARYEVTVPVEIEFQGEYYEDMPSINVYYYTSNQNVSDGVDVSVKDHLHIPNMYEESWNEMWEGID